MVILTDITGLMLANWLLQRNKYTGYKLFFYYQNIKLFWHHYSNYGQFDVFR